VLDQSISRHVDIGSGLIQEEDPVPPEADTGQGQELPLAHTQVPAIFRQWRHQRGEDLTQ